MADERLNILMVDDEPAKLLSYEAILSDLGENLIHASSPRKALNILLDTDVALVLMDVSMPEMDGFELAEVIRQHPRFERTAIIFISGVHLTDSDRILGYRRGAVDYISVPIIPEVLRAKVSVFVELHRKTRQLEKLNSNLEQLVRARTEQLRLSEDLFRKRAELLELASEAIIERDLSGEIRFWNAGAENLYGWTRAEAVGRDIHTLLKTDFPISRNQLQEELQNEGSWQGNLIQTTRDGKEIIVAFRKMLNREANAVLEVGRDITSQMRAEEVLRENEKLAAMGRFAGIIAHEINNPLAAITNVFYLLRQHPSLDEEARHFATMADQELQRISHITKQTLSFYRESKRPVPVLLHELADDVLDLQARPMQALHITAVRKYSSALSVVGFPAELKQVVMNLVSNAVQALVHGGKLRVRVFAATDWATNQHGSALCITDTGVGIRPDEARHIFEPFYTTKSLKGTGLGLWISKGIIQKYGGQITFRCHRHSGGTVTCFRVFIPSGMALNALTETAEQPGDPAHLKDDSTDPDAYLAECRTS